MGKINVDKIELKNFYSYGGQWQSIDLREGVNIVLGHDKDKERSNGAGKTSFLEAIPFALFGQTSKGVALPKIINWKNGSKCEVKLHFRKDGVSYMIHRGIKPGILELVKDGVPVPKLSDKRVFQQELETDLLGIDFKAAEAILFQNANNVVSIFNTPKAEKRRFIEKFFNLEIYSKMNEHTNGKLANVIKRLAEIDMEIGFKTRRIEELTKSISDSVAPDMESYQNKVDEAMSRLGQFTADNLVIFQERPQMEDEMVELRQERTNLQGDLRIEMVELGRIEDQLNLLKGESTTLEKRNETIGDLTEQREKLEKVKKVLSTLEGLEEDLAEKKKVVSGEKELLSSHKVTLGGFVSQKKQLNDTISKWQNRDGVEDTTCPTCFQEVDFDHIKDHIETECAKLDGELNVVDDSIKEYQEIIRELEIRIEDRETGIKEVEDKIGKKNQLKQALAKLEGVEEKQKEFDENDKRIEGIKHIFIPELESKHNKVQEDIDSISSDIDLNNNLIEEKQVLYQEYKDLRTKEQQLSKDLETETKIYASQKEIYDRIMAEHQSNIDTKTALESEVEEFAGETKKLNTMKDYLEYIKETLKDTNVKQYAIGNIIPFLQQQTNHYLSETGHNYYIELDAWLDGTIKGYGVGECEFGNMSGGEGKSIDLALKFAMMDVARRQAGSYLDILVLDELLDSSIDSHGIEKTFDIIKMKQREDNLKVFVVSHREEVADFGVDNTYKVTKEDGFSTIEVD